MSFTPEKLKDRFRTDLDDVNGGTQGEDFLWSDEEVFEYLDEAQREFVRETKILRSSYPFKQTLNDGSEFTALTFTASGADGFLDYNPRIIKTLNARMQVENRSEPLAILNFEQLNEGYFDSDYHWLFRRNWQAQTGPARFLITNMEENKYRLVPIPVLDDVVELIVLHQPVYDITCESTTFEVTDREDQKTILLYAKSLAFMKQDADIYDKDLADRFEAAFVRKVARRTREIYRQRFRAQNVKYGGIPL